MSNTRIQHLVYVVAMVCTTISCTRTPNNSRDAVAESNNFVFVATIGGDPELSAHLYKLLDDQGIGSIIEGSAYYGVQVPAAQHGKALKVLTDDSATRGYWIKFHLAKESS